MGKLRFTSDYDLLSPRWRYNKSPFRLKLLHFNDLHGHISRIRRVSGNEPIFSRLFPIYRQNRAACAGNDYRAVLVFRAGTISLVPLLIPWW
jgi:2',3'-cyclic-nucleotide 2'-phosphodiesterase (5'-nucleotidase family)